MNKIIIFLYIILISEPIAIIDDQSLSHLNNGLVKPHRLSSFTIVI